MKLTRNHRTIKEADEIPDGKHYAALEFSTVTIPGDERSRTNPGHGYPEEIKVVANYIQFDDEEAMKEWVMDKKVSDRGKENYCILEAQKLGVKLSMVVEVERPKDPPPWFKKGGK
jgi:hypothetical protein